MRTRIFYLLLVICGIGTACNDANSNKAAGKPIVLGDSATIVTETDPQYLKDFVADIQPAKQQEPEVPADTAKPAAQQEPAPEQAQPEQATAAPKEEALAPQANGLNVAFKDVSILIPNIETKGTGRQRDYKNANGASFQLEDGKLNGNQIKITSGNVQKVSQRYQTVIVIKNNLGELPLESLSNTTNWQPLNGRGNSYTISGLDNRHLDYIKATPAAIRNAVTRAARNHRMSRATEQKWLNSIKHVRVANQPPMAVMLRSVMWKIEGKDARGRNYQKQIRMDIPL